MGNLLCPVPLWRAQQRGPQPPSADWKDLLGTEVLDTPAPSQQRRQPGELTYPSRFVCVGGGGGCPLPTGASSASSHVLSVLSTL